MKILISHTNKGKVNNEIGWYRKSSDCFICSNCFSKEENFDKEGYDLIREDDLRENVFTCDKCGKEIMERERNKSMKEKTTSLLLENKGKDTKSDLVLTLGHRGENIIKDNIPEEEEILVKLKGSFGEGLVISNKKVYVLKWGFMSGNTVGSKCTTFDFSNIVGLEIRKSLATGIVEILTPATQNTKRSYWGRGKNSAIKSDNIVTFQSNQFKSFQEAVRLGRELITKSSSKEDVKKNNGLELDQLERLAELKEKGIITQEEFDCKKKQILEL